jgi:sortase A
MTDTLIATPDAPPEQQASPPQPAPPAPEVQKPPAPRDRALRILRDGLTLFAVLCVALASFLFLGSRFVHSRDQTGLMRTFRAEAAGLILPPLFDQQGHVEAIPEGSPIALLSIPKIGLHDEVVVEGSTPSRTEAGPGHLPATPLPGQRGNSVIVGRRFTYGAPFLHIDRLQKDDVIEVVTGGGNTTNAGASVRVKYQVIAKGEVPASDRNVFGTISQDGQRINTLTLVTTSNPPLTSSGRYVVEAALVGQAVDWTPVPYRARPDELGLAGEPGGWLPLIGMLELLLVVSVGSVWLFRRWNRACAWIVTVPVLVTVTWLVFEQLTRVLPSAL